MTLECSALSIDNLWGHLVFFIKELVITMKSAPRFKGWSISLSGLLSRKGFNNAVSSPLIRSLLRSLDIDLLDMADIFGLMIKDSEKGTKEKSCLDALLVQSQKSFFRNF